MANVENIIIEDLKPSRVDKGIDLVQNDNLTKEDMMEFIVAAIKEKGLVGHNLVGYNSFLDSGVSYILNQLFNIMKPVKNERKTTAADKEIKSFQICIEFSKVHVGKPMKTTYNTGQTTELTPSSARITGLTYAAPLILDANIVLKAHYDNRVEEKRAEVNSFQIEGIPVMVKSSHCHTVNLSDETLREIGEDPTDPGGYFIVAHQEWAVNLGENIIYNWPLNFIKIKPSEEVRTEMLSQFGNSAFENSSMNRIRYMQNGRITIELNSVRLEKAKIPFFLIYYLFGMTNAKEITETIVFDINSKSPITLAMLRIVDKAFHNVDPLFEPLLHELNHERIVQMTAENLTKYLTNKTAYQSNDSAIQYLNEDLLGSATKPGGLDKIILPHMGQTPDARITKLRLIGLIIHKMLLVHLGVLPCTDRDSLTVKRVHGPGIAIAKAFKTHVNNTVIGPIIKSLRRVLNTEPWSSITPKLMEDTFRSTLASTDLAKAMEQSVTAGSKTTTKVGKYVSANRVISHSIERKNDTNLMVSLNTVESASHNSKSSDQSGRGDEMRRVHPSNAGLICLVKSAGSGKQVGMHKELASTASVTGFSDTEPLKIMMKTDPDIILLKDLKNSEMINKSLSRIFINGEWFGACANPHALTTRYRLLRREGRVVDLHTTIAWDPITGEISFWLDAGRIYRPLLIVENNIDEYDESRRSGNNVPFVQNTRFTLAHAKRIMYGELTLADLIREGIAEYVTAEEQQNCLIAESIEILRAHRNDVRVQYTHCEVEQAVCGLSTLVSPYGGHTQPARVTYLTTHAKQAGGWYGDFPNRADKLRFFQYFNEESLVTTISRHFIRSNGVNAFVTYMSYKGNNQEDSAIVSKAAADRGLFAGIFVRYELVTLEINERICNPDILTTKGIKPGACYEKLVNGVITVGSTVEYGDVLVGKVAKINKNDPNEKMKEVDKSVISRYEERCRVVEVLKPRGPNDAQFVLVKLQFIRHLKIGDKLSSRSGNKAIVSEMPVECDMPFMENGLTPDIIIGTNSFPTRMFCGQIIETSVGKVCARKGSIVDGTIFLPVDHYEVSKQLYSSGFRYNGRERMYNGMTGEYYDTAMFIGPAKHFRLLKFVLDEEQAVSGSGPTDALTGQPVGGKRAGGGLRLGEMEFWVLEAQGAMMNLYEKTKKDSDGRIMYVCRNCGSLAVFNEKNNIYICKVCGEFADIAAVESSKAAILFHEELTASGINVKLGLRPREFEK